MQTITHRHILGTITHSYCIIFLIIGHCNASAPTMAFHCGEDVHYVPFY
ncbi:MAG: hypothetical protein KIG87_08790 [Muribaculaceae bacterium]|nr:hypothetical protein [Muribaculaceae bacterium]MDD6869311.1 hypothetical protein [bacterium]MDY5828142.1 hypothetical protein [Candidatus Limisoma sp.]